MGLLAIAFLATTSLIVFSSATILAQDEGFTSDDASGNDPREFSSKFMPYYRYTQLENDLEVNDFTLFGFYAFNPRFGMTYEWAVAKEIDYSDVSAFKAFKAGGGGGKLPPNGPNPGGGGGLPFDDLDDDGDVVGRYQFPGLASGDYIVEIVPPPGYEILKPEDKNVDFGDEYITSELLLPPECVGADYTVPNFLSLNSDLSMSRATSQDKQGSGNAHGHEGCKRIVGVAGNTNSPP